MKRYNLEMPDELWERIDRIATQRDVSAAALMRSILRFGLDVFEKDQDVIIRDARKHGGREKVIEIVL